MSTTQVLEIPESASSHPFTIGKETVYDVKSAATELGVTPIRIRKMIQKGQLPGAKMMGKTWFIPSVAVELAKNRPSAGRPPAGGGPRPPRNTTRYLVINSRGKVIGGEEVQYPSPNVWAYRAAVKSYRAKYKQENGSLPDKQDYSLVAWGTAKSVQRQQGKKFFLKKAEPETEE